jgi:uncharacterized metal-binding protein YceD (DUF177 family)
MSAIIQIDRFTRQSQFVSGKYAPGQLPRLAEHLAGEEGEILFSMTGSEITELAGSQKQRIKCIISGWFLVVDPGSLKPVRHDFAIESRLVLVKDESALPPLEFESEDEDYIICGPEMNVMDRIEEEILLDLPLAFAGRPEAGGKWPKSGAVKAVFAGNGQNVRLSPFARLEELKAKKAT